MTVYDIQQLSAAMSKQAIHDDPVMQAVFDAAWGQWPNLLAMKNALSAKQHIYAIKARGDLFPAEFDLAVVARARENGSPLSLRDLAWFRQKRGEQKRAA